MRTVRYSWLKDFTRATWSSTRANTKFSYLRSSFVCTLLKYRSLESLRSRTVTARSSVHWGWSKLLTTTWLEKSSNRREKQVKERYESFSCIHLPHQSDPAGLLTEYSKFWPPTPFSSTYPSFALSHFHSSATIHSERRLNTRDMRKQRIDRDLSRSSIHTVVLESPGRNQQLSVYL